jgi:flagellar hook protein FlgE
MGVGNIANSGLQAAMTNMETISNNIANVNTVGFKKSSVSFSDVYANSFANTNQVGFGVQTQAIRQDFSTGSYDTTGKPLDLSLAGDGFFVQKSANGQISYTRAGELQIDKNGYFLGANGRLQGYPAVNGVLSTTGTLVDLIAPDTPLAPKSTSNILMNMNLSSDATIPANAFNENDPTTYNFRNDATVYDSLGTAHDMSVYYVKTADDTWSTQILIDNNSIASGSISFLSSGAFGSESGMTNLSWSPTGGATSPQTISLNYNSATQFSGASKEYQTASQDGYPAGIANGYGFNGDGDLTIYYSNGQSQLQGRVAVAQFLAPQGLSEAENMSWLATNNSGAPIFDVNSGVGAIGVGKLELSNVDLTEELVNLMGAQHDFQANAQVAQTYNQMLQTIENI